MPDNAILQDVARNLAVLRAYERHIESAVAREQWETGIALTTEAADFAWYNTTGSLTSWSLEASIQQIADRSLPACSGVQNSGRVLHVLSEAHHSAGGHVRMAWRWIQRDNTHKSDVIITNQPGHEGPSPALIDAVQSTGGSVRVLNTDNASFLGRARGLRAVINDYEFVVLHIHPYDAIACAALANDLRPPTIFVDHADHVFWLGCGVTDLLANSRAAGATLAVDRRGFSQAQTGFIPLAVEAPRMSERNVVRQELGIDDAAIVLVTAASAYKYEPNGEASFLDLVGPIMQQHNNVVLLALGGGERPHWEQASRDLGGRIRLLGRQSDVSRFFSASDIYLDSLPVTSITSVLEAATYGLPSLGFAQLQTHSLLSAQDYVDRGVLVQPANAQQYMTILRSWIENDELRRIEGQRMFDVMSQTSLSPGWERHLEALYEQAKLLKSNARHQEGCVGVQLGDLETQTWLAHVGGAMSRDTAAFMQRVGVSANDVQLALTELMTADVPNLIVVPPCEDVDTLMISLTNIAEALDGESFHVVLLDSPEAITRLIAPHLEGDVTVVQCNSSFEAALDELSRRAQSEIFHIADPRTRFNAVDWKRIKDQFESTPDVRAIEIEELRWVAIRRSAIMNGSWMPAQMTDQRA